MNFALSAVSCPVIAVANSSKNSSDTSFQTRVSVTCNEGHYMSLGRSTVDVTCLEAGVWSETLDHCTRTYKVFTYNHIHKLAPTFMYMSVSDNTIVLHVALDLTFLDFIYYVYSRQSVLPVPAAICTDVPKLGNATASETTAVYPDSVTYTCRQGHTFSGNRWTRVSRCLQDGSWELTDECCSGK